MREFAPLREDDRCQIQRAVGKPLLEAILAIETAAKYCGVTVKVLVETNMGAGMHHGYGTEEQPAVEFRRMEVGGKARNRDDRTRGRDGSEGVEDQSGEKWG